MILSYSPCSRDRQKVHLILRKPLYDVGQRPHHEMERVCTHLGGGEGAFASDVQVYWGYMGIMEIKMETTTV